MNKRTRTALAGITALCMAALTACSSGIADKNFESINDLGKAYEKAASVECRESSIDVQKYGWTNTGCGLQTTVAIFTSDAKREEIKQKNPLDSGEVWIQGGNWLVTAAQYEAEEANESLKGEIIKR